MTKTTLAERNRFFVSLRMTYKYRRTPLTSISPYLKYMNNPNAKVKIIGAPIGEGKIQLVNGILMNEISFSGNNSPSDEMKSKKGGIVTWTGSSKLQLNLQLLFVALNPTDDVTAEVKNLMKGFYPKEGNKKVYEAPMGYQVDKTGEAKGTWTVLIGQWFKAANLVMTSCSATFSKAAIITGLPLYAQVSVGFESYKNVSYQDVEKYFVGRMGNSTEVF